MRANEITKYLASHAGGPLKDGGGGMLRGLEILLKQAGIKGGVIGAVSTTTLAVLGYIYLDRHNKKSLRNLIIYHRLIHENKILDIQKISEAVSRPPEIVKKEIQNLIKKGLLTDVKIDVKSNRIIISQ